MTKPAKYDKMVHIYCQEGAEMPIEAEEKIQTEEKYSQVKTLKKALDLLEYFSIEHPEWSISELSRVSGLYKSNIYNILYTFSLCGYIEKVDGSDKYRLGKQFLDKAHIVQTNLTNLGLIHRSIIDLARATSEIVYFGILNNSEVMYIDIGVPENRYTTKSAVGMTAPAYCTGIGKALLSACKPEIVENLLQTPLDPITPQTITNPDEMRKELAIIQARGYSIDNREHDNNVKCVAVPLYDRNGNLYGAISVSGPASRFPQETVEYYASLLKNAAMKLQIHL